MRNTAILASLLLAATSGGCRDETPPPAANAPWILTDLPAGAIAVAEAKRGAREGDRVVVRGRIGGRRDAMSDDIALFVMMDPAIPHCEIGHCKMPWDYCCETPESITANSATVQVVGADGAPLHTDLGRYAFKPLDEVVVVGTVGPRPTDEVFVIRASALHRLTD